MFMLINDFTEDTKFAKSILLLTTICMGKLGLCDNGKTYIYISIMSIMLPR